MLSTLIIKRFYIIFWRVIRVIQFIMFKQYVLGTAWVIWSEQHRKLKMYVYTTHIRLVFSSCNNRDIFFGSNALPDNQFIPTSEKKNGISRSANSFQFTCGEKPKLRCITIIKITNCSINKSSVGVYTQTTN